MNIRIKSASGRLPEYQTAGSAGMDLTANLEYPLAIAPGERALVPTGLFLEIPPGYEAQIRARSGLAVKHGIGLVNGIGTVDSDYRGEIKIPLINWGKQEFLISDGDRIAQLVISKYERVTLEDIGEGELAGSERGSGGFGHTGV